MSGFRADLHSHTTCSDGSDTPIELLKKAKAAGLQGLSITDHDTIDAYTPELFSFADTLGIQLLPGIELSSELNEQTVHVLGYGIDIHSLGLQKFLVEMIQRRRERNTAIIEKLKKRKMIVTMEELEALGTRTIGRPHIAAIMVRKGYVSSMSQAFDQYLREGACCYTPGIKFTPQEVVEEIHKAKGKAVLAHPHFIKRGSLLKKLLGLPLDGLECYYANLYPEQEKPWIKLAKEKGWIATGGSDYHGSVKPHISLGCSWVGLETFHALQSLSSNKDCPN